MSKSSSLSMSVSSFFSDDWKYLLVLTARVGVDVVEVVFPAARFVDLHGLGLTFLSSVSSSSVMPLHGRTDRNKRF